MSFVFEKFLMNIRHFPDISSKYATPGLVFIYYTGEKINYYYIYDL